MSEIKVTAINEHKENKVIKIPTTEIKEDENRVESAQKLIVKVRESEPQKPKQFVVKVESKQPEELKSFEKCVFAFSVDKEMADRLKTYAEVTGLAVNEIITESIKEYLATHIDPDRT